LTTKVIKYDLAATYFHLAILADADTELILGSLLAVE
jgi:hypothetical protein